MISGWNVKIIRTGVVVLTEKLVGRVSLRAGNRTIRYAGGSPGVSSHQSVPPAPRLAVDDLQVQGYRFCLGPPLTERDFNLQVETCNPGNYQ
jgi:hypothetical protein